jgi:hypothetical protein
MNITGTGRRLPELPPGRSMLQGALSAVVVVLPAGVLNQLVVGGETGTPPIAFVLWAVILVGGAAGGWATIRLSPTAPLPYAAGAAALAYGAVQAIGVVRRLLVGGDISWLAYPFLALLMATCGTLGGLFARRWISG